jgi:hypothetical protein
MAAVHAPQGCLAAPAGLPHCFGTLPPPAGLDAYTQLVRRCWAQKQLDRPAFQDIVRELRFVSTGRPGVTTQGGQAGRQTACGWQAGRLAGRKAGWQALAEL